MLFIFYFGKKARASFICKRFLFPESNDPPPKAANSESNEGRYYRNSTVRQDAKILALRGVRRVSLALDFKNRNFELRGTGLVYSHCKKIA